VWILHQQDGQRFSHGRRNADQERTGDPQNGDTFSDKDCDDDDNAMVALTVILIVMLMLSVLCRVSVHPSLRTNVFSLFVL
jgi:hypothetical protein